MRRSITFMRSSIAIRAAAAALILVVGGQITLSANNGSAAVQAQATMAATMAGTMAAQNQTADIATLANYHVALFASSTSAYFASRLAGCDRYECLY